MLVFLAIPVFLMFWMASSALVLLLWMDREYKKRMVERCREPPSVLQEDAQPTSGELHRQLTELINKHPEVLEKPGVPQLLTAVIMAAAEEHEVEWEGYPPPDTNDPAYA
jgi:hypothetical protein